MLRERDELMSYKAGTKEAAEASYRIRLRLKALREDLSKLQTLQRQDELKKVCHQFKINIL